MSLWRLQLRFYGFIAVSFFCNEVSNSNGRLNVVDHITSSAANFETILSLLSSFFVPQDENALLTWISRTLKDKKLRNNIQNWRTEWKQLVKDGKDRDVLL